MIRDRQIRGADEPTYKIACLSSSCSLIIGNFEVNGDPVRAILDTGATASFLAGNCTIAHKSIMNQRVIMASAVTANHDRITIKKSASLEIKPLNHDKTFVSNFFILPDINNIMGYQLVVGLDLIMSMDINIEQRNNQMIARIGHKIIGKQNSANSNDSSILSTSHLEIPLNESHFNQLADDYQDIFSETAVTLIKTEPMLVPIFDREPTKVRLRTHSREDIIEIDRQINLMLANDIIEPSNSEFSANVHLVPKKNGTKRMVIDFRPLNEITRKDPYPLPQISDMFRALEGAKYFSALDCTEGFLQVPVAKSHRERTAFITHRGQYHFKRSPFGFTNSPAKFQRVMNDVFLQGLYKRCVIYIDDVLVFGKSPEELMDNLTWVLNQCREWRVKLKRTKCKLFNTTVEFLGFLISENKIGPVRGKYDPVGIEWPKTRNEVLAILGAFNHYARFIPNYSEKIAPIRSLTRKGVAIIWSEELANIVTQLKQDLDVALPTIIAPSSSTKVVEITINPSSYEVTCYSDKNEFIMRAGSCFGSSEFNYTTVEQQLLAILLAYRKFGPFLRGKVTFKTTCSELKRSLNMKERSVRVDRFMLRLPPDIEFDIIVVTDPNPIPFASFIESDAEEIFYTDGASKNNGKKDSKAAWAVLATLNSKLSCSGILDANEKATNQTAELYAVIKACQVAISNKLKRIVIVTDSKYVANAINLWIVNWTENGWLDTRKKQVINMNLFKELAELLKLVNVDCKHVKGHSTDMNNMRVDQMAKEALMDEHTLCLLNPTREVDQTQDAQIAQIRNNLENDPNLRDKYQIINDQLYYIDHHLPANCRNRLFVPQSDRRIYLKLSHDDPLYGGHLGYKKTKVKLMGYYWPGISKDIERYIQTCSICQQNKTPKTKRFGLLQPIKTSKIFDRVHIDIVSLQIDSRDGNRYIVTAIDGFSRYAFAKAYARVNATTIISFITEEIISKHGIMKQISSDNGPQFVSNLFKEFIDKLGIRHGRTCDYHPEANGLDERLNGSLVKIIRNYVESNQQDWDKQLPWAIYLYNTSPHETLGTSPYVALYGVSPRNHLQGPIADPNNDCPTLTRDQIREIISNSISVMQDKQKDAFDRKRQPQDFKPFDLVDVKTRKVPLGLARKLYHSWDGPWWVKRLIVVDNNEVAAELIRFGKNKIETKRCPFQDMKRHLSREREPDLPTTIGEQVIELASDNRRFRDLEFNEQTSSSEQDIDDLQSTTLDEIIPISLMMGLRNRGRPINQGVLSNHNSNSESIETPVPPPQAASESGALSDGLMECHNIDASDEPILVDKRGSPINVHSSEDPEKPSSICGDNNKSNADLRIPEDRRDLHNEEFSFEGTEMRCDLNAQAGPLTSHQGTEQISIQSSPQIRVRVIPNQAYQLESTPNIDEQAAPNALRAATRNVSEIVNPEVEETIDEIIANVAGRHGIQRNVQHSMNSQLTTLGGQSSTVDEILTNIGSASRPVRNKKRPDFYGSK